MTNIITPHKLGQILFNKISESILEDSHQETKLRKQNKRKRLKWFQKHKNWTGEQWVTAQWSDESKFQVFGFRRRVFVYRSSGKQMLDQCVIPTVKQGKDSAMVWECFGRGCTGDHIKIEGILKKERYLKLK